MRRVMRSCLVLLFLGSLLLAQSEQAIDRPPSMTTLRVRMETIAELSARVMIVPLASDPPRWTVLVSDPDRLAERRTIRERMARLADPRAHPAERLAADREAAPLVVLVTAGVHPREPSATAGLVDLVRFLATTTDPVWVRRLSETLIVIDPCLDPLGHDALVAWMRATDEDPATRGCPPPFPVHRFAGRDLNRDALLVTQPETAVTLRMLYRRWWPQVVIDRHEMPDRDAYGRAMPRLFLPPYREPHEPHLHALQLGTASRLGGRATAALRAQGHTGIASTWRFDGWSPARGAPAYFGATRMLVEVAHGDRRTRPPHARPHPIPGLGPSFVPWPGGAWTQADARRTSNAATLAILGAAADERARLLQEFVAVRRDQARAPEGLGGWLLPVASDHPALAHLLHVLETHGVRYGETMAPCAGHPAGAVFIPAAQPAGAWLRATFEKVPYRDDGSAPYDMTSHLLPAWFGLEAKRVSTADTPSPLTITAAVPGVHFARRWKEQVPRHPLAREMRALASAHREGSRRIGVLTTSAAWSDEGWTRWWFDRIGIAPEEIAASETDGAGRSLADRLGRIRVLVLPDVPRETLLGGAPGRLWPAGWRGGIGAAGLEALLAFVEEGGTLIASGRATDLLRPAFEKDLRPGGPSGFGPPPRIVGAHLLAHPVTDHELAESSPKRVPFPWWNGRSFALPEGSRARAILRIDGEAPAVSGLAPGAEALRGAVLAASIDVGAGRIVFFGVSPAFRGGPWPLAPAFTRALARPPSSIRKPR